MSEVREDEAALLSRLRAGSPIRGLVQLLGEVPARVTLERAHFPRARPVQLNLAARLGSGTVVPVLAEHIPEGAAAAAARALASLAKERHGQRAGLVPSAIVADSETGLVLRRPGLDERLPGLRLLHDPDAARAMEAGLTGRDPGPVRVNLVAHRLGKRAVLRIAAGGTVRYARLRATKSGDGASRLARHRRLWEALGDGAPLRIPAPLGEVPDLGLSLFAQLPGTPPDFGDGDAAGILARALAALRSSDPGGLPAHTGRDEALLLAEWLDRCRLYRPDAARALAAAVAEISGRLAHAGAACAPSHRDLHEKQILISGGVAGLLDFDTLSLADPALDPGNLAAHLFLAGRSATGLCNAVDLPGLGLWRRAALARVAMIHAVTSMPDESLGRLIREACRDDRD